MIVPCASCQTKFRVPDDKIGERPVKVRCSKCQSVFGVRRGANGEAEAVALPPKPGATITSMPVPSDLAEPAPKNDPFAAFGPPPEVRKSETTTPGVWHAGIAATRSPARATGDVEITKSGIALHALVASKLVASDAAPPAPTPSTEEPDAPGAPVAPTGFFSAIDLPDLPHLANAPPAAPAAAPSDPFAGLGTSPASDPFSDPFAGLGIAQPAPSAAPSTPLSDPFEALSVPRPAAPAASAPLAPAASAPPSDPFAGLDLAPAPAPAPNTESDPFAGLDLGGAPRSAPPAPAPLPESVSFSFESADPAGATPTAAPPASAQAGSLDDFFGAAPAPEPPRPTSSVGFEALTDEAPALSAEPDHSLFDLPPAPPPSTPPPQIFEAPDDPASQAPAPAMQARPTSIPTPKPSAHSKSLGLRVMGGALNVLFVLAVGWASLLTYATAKAGWHFDPGLLRPAVLGRALFGARTRAAQLELSDISSGRYALADGQSAFFVRGTLVNAGKQPVGPARAHVELLAHAQVVARADAWAGPLPTPEQVFDLGGAEQLAALEQASRAQAKPLAPGERRPFLALVLNVPATTQIQTIKVEPELPGAQ